MAYIEEPPQWDEPGVEPPETKRESGYAPGDKPPAQWINWFQNRVYKVLTELQSKSALAEDLNSFPRNMAQQAIINGNFDVWQRGTSFTNPSVLYTADRFKFGTTGELGMPTLTHSRQQIAGELQGSAYCYRLTTSGTGSAFGVDTEYVIAQAIERGTCYLCGQGKKVTLSFYARSNIAGKRIGLSIGQRYGTGGIPSSEDILPGAIFDLTSSWTKFTFTFDSVSLSGKTFGTNNDDYLVVKIWMAWGTNKAAINFGGGTAENFGGAGNIDIAQVQLNAGDRALHFQPRNLAEELALCQRYYERFEGSAGIGHRYYNNGSTAGSVAVNGFFRVQKRIAPSMVILVYDINDGSTSNVQPGSVTKDGFSHTFTSVPAGQFVDVQTWTADAEL